MTKRTHHPACPHCHYEFNTDETWCSQQGKTGEVLLDDGDISELSCPQCKKPFHAICQHDIFFKACDENGEDVDTIDDKE